MQMAIRMVGSMLAYIATSDLYDAGEPAQKSIHLLTLLVIIGVYVWEIICVTGWAKPGGIEELVPHQVCSTLDRQCPGLGRLKSHYWTDWHLWICTVLCTINQQPGGPYGELVT